MVATGTTFLNYSLASASDGRMPSARRVGNHAAARLARVSAPITIVGVVSPTSGIRISITDWKPASATPTIVPSTVPAASNANAPPWRALASFALRGPPEYRSRACLLSVVSIYALLSFMVTRGIRHLRPHRGAQSWRTCPEWRDTHPSRVGRCSRLRNATRAGQTDRRWQTAIDH